MEGKVYCKITPQAISMTGNIVDAESERYQTKIKQFNNTTKVGTLSYLGSIYHGCPLTYQAYLYWTICVQGAQIESFQKCSANARKGQALHQ